MKRAAFFALALLFLCLSARAQEDFREGYIITLEHDTVAGFVNYRGGNTNSKASEFKKSLSDPVKVFKPSDIKGYGFVNDKFYQSITSKESDEEGAIFVEVLVKGVVSLYKDHAVLYVSKGDTTIHELSITKEIQHIKDKTGIRKSSRHIGILAYMMQDCEKVQQKIKKASVSEKFLTELVEEYNTCISAPYISYKENKPWLKFKFGAAAVYRMSQPTFSTEGAGFDYLKEGEFEGHDVAAGALIEMYSPRINERLAFQVGALYSNATYTSHTEKKGFYATYRNDITFSIKELYIPFGVQYKIFETAYAPYINIGMSSTLHLQSKYLRVYEYKENELVYSRESRNFPFSESRLGFWAGLGVERKITGSFKGFAEFRYEQSNGFYDPFALNSPIINYSNMNSFNFFVGVKF